MSASVLLVIFLRNQRMSVEAHKELGRRFGPQRLVSVDFVDREIVVSMFPALEAEWACPTRRWSRVVSITIAVFSFPIALVADRWSRVKSIAAMAVVRGLATIACGLSRNIG